MNIQSSQFLRTILYIDAATCFATGLLMIFGATFLEIPLGLPVDIHRFAGISLFPFALILFFIAGRNSIARQVIIAVIIANIAWVILSFYMIVAQIITPTPLGQLYVVGQAVAVAVLAELEFLGMRKSQIVNVSST